MREEVKRLIQAFRNALRWSSMLKFCSRNITRRHSDFEYDVLIGVNGCACKAHEEFVDALVASSDFLHYAVTCLMSETRNTDELYEILYALQGLEYSAIFRNVKSDSLIESIREEVVFVESIIGEVR